MINIGRNLTTDFYSPVSPKTKLRRTDNTDRFIQFDIEFGYYLEIGNCDLKIN